MSSYPNHFDIACFLPLSRRLHVTAPDASRDGRHGARPGDAYTASGPGVCRPFFGRAEDLFRLNNGMSFVLSNR